MRLWKHDKLLRLRVFAGAAILPALLWGTATRAQSGLGDLASSTTAPVFREVTDEVGRTVRIPQPVRRIVSLAPSLTETIYALGLEDRLVGDTDYCDYPPEAQKKNKVGGGINPSIEAIAALHPDLVVVTKGFNRLETVHGLEKLGIVSYATDPHTVEEIITSSKKLADILGVAQSGNTLAEEMRHRLAELQRKLGAIQATRVLFVVWTQPLISVGQNTFIADAIRWARATSIVNADQSWPQVSLEEVARLQPDYLVFSGAHSEAVPLEVEHLAGLPGWQLLDAVTNHRYAVVSEAVNRPAPRIVEAIEELARQLHPEAFTEMRESGKKKTEKRPSSPGEPHLKQISFPVEERGAATTACGGPLCGR